MNLLPFLLIMLGLTAVAAWGFGMWLILDDEEDEEQW